MIKSKNKLPDCGLAPVLFSIYT